MTMTLTLMTVSVNDRSSRRFFPPTCNIATYWIINTMTTTMTIIITRNSWTQCTSLPARPLKTRSNSCSRSTISTVSSKRKKEKRPGLWYQLVIVNICTFSDFSAQAFLGIGDEVQSRDGLQQYLVARATAVLSTFSDQFVMCGSYRIHRVLWLWLWSFLLWNCWDCERWWWTIFAGDGLIQEAELQHVMRFQTSFIIIIIIII